MILTEIKKWEDFLQDISQYVLDKWANIHLVQQSQKKDNTPVSEVDHFLDESLKAFISKYSSYPILSEEDKFFDFDGLKKTDFSYWLLDPLDGTSRFLNGKPGFCLNVCLIIQGEPFFGFIFDFVKKEIWYAKKNEGGHFVDMEPIWREEKIRRVSIEDKTRACVIMSSREREINFSSIFPDLQVRFSSAALKYAEIIAAKGYFSFRLKSLNSTWDIASAQLIIEEIGGSFFSLNERKLNYRPQKEEDLTVSPFLMIRAKKDDDVTKQIVTILKKNLKS